MKKFLASMVLLGTFVAPATADVRITEVAPWASGFSPVGADWFELTNTGASALNIVGWKMDDISNSFANAVTLNGISSIAAGESVIFIEASSVANVNTFKAVWFGESVPAELQIGTYSGANVSLASSNDGVYVFNAGGAVQAGVTYATSTPFTTFDNAAGLNFSPSISQLSSVGVNGAFLAASGGEVGSPGVIASVPEPEIWAMLVAGLGIAGAFARRRGVA